MSIRRLLLASFLALSFLAAGLLTALAFIASRATLEREIGRSLQNDAAMLMEQVDLLMFERLQNIHSWSHLEIMQEARIGDVDKRLARFLGELKQGYGDLYRELYYADNDNRVVAASDPLWIGRHLAPPAETVSIPVPNGDALMDTPVLQPPYSDASLVIRALVPDSYGLDDIGQICGSFDLQRLFRLFDQASRASGDRHVALLDGRGRLLAASSRLRGQGLLMSDVLAPWRPASPETQPGVRDGAPLFPAEVLAGYAVSRGFQGYPGTGWSLLMLQTTEQAFRPIQALWWLFCISFAATALCAGWAAHLIAGRLSRPLLDLTAWARSFSRAETPAAPEVGGTPEIHALGKAFGQLVTSLDSSKRQVVHAAKLAVVGEMAAIMAHEVRAPLGILHTTAQMLQRDKELSPRNQDMTRMILEESRRLERLVSTLLECARPRPPQMSPHDIHELIERAVELLQGQARRKGIELRRQFRADAAVIRCDGELMVQVFLNLILNAVQILPPAGSVVVSTMRMVDGLRIEVADDGPGVPPECRSRVFDPFFTTREGGIGLGLTVTHQIVATHGGTIAVDNGPAGGARFILDLPNDPEQSHD
jgi:signal transduction histidine kinase